MTTSTPKNCSSCGTLLEQGADNLADGLCPLCLLASSLHSTIAGQRSASPPPHLEEVARAFPELEIIGIIGRGGMGAVYKAKQKSLDRLVALKLLPQPIAANPEFAKRFETEAKALANLNHANIVTVHEFGRREGFYFLLMEFVDGPNLRDLLRDHRLSPQEALVIVPPLCEALEFAHQRRIVHCDIKPENLLFNTDGKVKIADFGIARILGQTEVESGKIAGTPAYMAPEQKDSPHTIDTRADIYSLGVVIYEMLTGERPDSELTPPSVKNGELDVRLDQIVLRALEANPASRWPSANALNTELQTFLTERLGAPKVVPPKNLPYSRPWTARLGVGFAIAALVLYLVSLFASSYLRPLPEEEQQALINSYVESEMGIHDLDRQKRALHAIHPQNAEQRALLNKVRDQQWEMIKDSPLDPNRPGISDPPITHHQHMGLAMLSGFLAFIAILLGLRHFSWLRGQKEPLPALKAAMVSTLFGPALLGLLMILPILQGLLVPTSPLDPYLMSCLSLAVVFLLVAWALRRLLAWCRNLLHVPPFRPALLAATLLLAIGIAIPLTSSTQAYRAVSRELWEANRLAHEEHTKTFSAAEVDPVSAHVVATKRVKAMQRHSLYRAKPFHLALPQVPWNYILLGLPLLALLLAWGLVSKFQFRRHR